MKTLLSLLATYNEEADEDYDLKSEEKPRHLHNLFAEIHKKIHRMSVQKQCFIFEEACAKIDMTSAVFSDNPESGNINRASHWLPF